MNPIISLGIVLMGCVLFIKIIYFLQKKLFSSKKNKKKEFPFQKIATLDIDEKYKIMTLSIYGKHKTLLLGPQNAVVLDETTPIINNDEHNDLIHYQHKVQKNAS